MNFSQSPHFLLPVCVLEANERLNDRMRVIDDDL